MLLMETLLVGLPRLKVILKKHSLLLMRMIHDGFYTLVDLSMLQLNFLCLCPKVSIQLLTRALKQLMVQNSLLFGLA
jgi:hypothetical protein